MYVNGQLKTIKEKISLIDLIQQEGHDTERVAVEKNGKIVPRNSFKTEMLSDDDRIEIVCFVGGG